MNPTPEETYMYEAIKEAEKAALAGDVPVGCAIARKGEIIARGHNEREARKNALLHAEITAIGKACLTLGSRRLEGCDMYVTLEPCPMCAGAILMARVSRLYYGASDTNMGACGGVLNIFEEAFGYKPRIYKGVLQKECSGLLTDFFKKIRSREKDGV